MNIIIISDEFHFQEELNKAGCKLVAVEFVASWCTLSHIIERVFESLSVRYPHVVFLKVDIDQCKESTALRGVIALPTVLFFKNKILVGQIHEARPDALVNEIKKLCVMGYSAVQGNVDLLSMIDIVLCDCVNESIKHRFVESFIDSEGYLESDMNEVLILSYVFASAIKLHSLKIKAPEIAGPKTLKLFINRPRTLNFVEGDLMEPVETITILPEDLAGKRDVQLRDVRFQKVRNLQIYVKDNQGGAKTTRIDHLAIIGSPISTKHVCDFESVVEKKMKI